MCSQTGLTDRAEIFMIIKGEDFRAVYKMLSRYDPYGRRSWQNFLNSPTIHRFDDTENFSSIGPASFSVHFESGNKNTLSKNGHRLVINFLEISFCHFVVKIQNYMANVRHQITCTLPLRWVKKFQLNIFILSRN